MMLVGVREMLILVVVALALLGIGGGLGVLGSLAWTARDVAVCQALRAEAFESAWTAKKTLNDCTCAVTGRCGR